MEVIYIYSYKYNKTRMALEELENIYSQITSTESEVKKEWKKKKQLK